jgi:oxygen-independent coproporphyrinogen-3 oxidase
MALSSMTSLPQQPQTPLPAPRAAYIHVPFCRHRCGYCNFTLVAGRDDLIDGYLDALSRELSLLGGPHEVDTLFFGGGTPTHLPRPQQARLLEIVRRTFPLAEGGEISVEANPVDLAGDGAKLRDLAAAGVTRLSLGVQSFNPAVLAILERDHTPQQAAEAVFRAKAAIGSVSIDLIFGVPGQTLADWQSDLAFVQAANLHHVSTYGLTFEKGTAFWSRRGRGELTQADEELERQMYLRAIDTLTETGFEHYEVSNFARPGHRCRHNETYWLGESYFAAGPGASRFIARRRETNHRSTTTYIARLLAGQSPVAESESLGPEDAARERLVFALRRLEGIDAASFASQTGFSLEQLGGTALAQFLDLSLLEMDGGYLRLTRKGLLVSDSLWSAFLRV